MIHVGHVEEFAEADDLVMFLVDALVSLQEILCPVYALVSTATFGNADTIVRIIRIIDLNQPLVIAGMELSEPDGESPLVIHIATSLAGCMSRFAGSSWGVVPRVGFFESSE
jgi:hypothetical protein